MKLKNHEKFRRKIWSIIVNSKFKKPVTDYLMEYKIEMFIEAREINKYQEA